MVVGEVGAVDKAMVAGDAGEVAWAAAGVTQGTPTATTVVVIVATSGVKTGLILLKQEHKEPGNRTMY